MVDRYERFIASYLRLNAYFTITNFIVHDPKRRSNEVIGNYTEADILGVRMPYSTEQAGSLCIANDPSLIAGGHGKTDAVIAEVKSGRGNKPNTIWREGISNPAVEYIARFIGLHDERRIGDVSHVLASTFRFEDDRHRIRYIIFAHEPNILHVKRGHIHSIPRYNQIFGSSARAVVDQFQFWASHPLIRSGTRC
jgi:hypothetical protein